MSNGRSKIETRHFTGKRSDLQPVGCIVKTAWLLIAGLTALPHAYASDLAAERRIAAQIETAALDGEPLYLNDGQRDFISIYTRTTRSTTQGGVLILHGKGGNPDDIDVIRPLRTGLPAHGWDTLSIQLPLEREGASDAEWEQALDDALPRINVAVAQFEQRQIPNIVVLGHGLGARAASRYLAGQPPDSVRALVLISMTGERGSPSVAALEKIQLPVLDIHGERDLALVLDSADARRLAAADGGNDKYRQRVTAAADHFFTGMSDQLLAQVRAWINRYAGATAPRTKP